MPAYRPGRIYITLCFTIATALVALIPGRGYDWTAVVLWSLLAAVLLAVIHAVTRQYRTLSGRAWLVLVHIALQSFYIEIFAARLVGLPVPVTVILFALVPLAGVLTYLLTPKPNRRGRNHATLALGPAAGAAIGFAVTRPLVSVFGLAFAVTMLVALAVGWMVLSVWFFTRTYQASRRNTGSGLSELRAK
ncbi:MAG: hypothetical protein J2P57_13175 [Acidimicrobiaceae bacterium]|nr:hypothetical protein [Acidimicrobiaceae bacterium]